ncbi:MAG: T9SS type A sorting domain-containing protein [Cyclobacteriaceae bacterium]
MRSTRFKILLFSAFSFIFISSNAQKYWDGGAGTTNWTDGNNWSPNGVPGNGSDVIIGSGDVVVISSTITQVPDDITIEDGGSLTIASGGSLATDNNGGNQGTLTMNDGGVLNITGGTLDIGDRAYINSGSVINITSGMLDIDNDMFVDNATVNISGGELEVGTVGNDYSQFSNGSTLNMSGGTFDNQDMYFDDSDWNASSGSYDGDWFQATGTSTVDFVGDSDMTANSLIVAEDAVWTFDGDTMDVNYLEAQDDSEMNLDGGTVTVDYLGAFDDSVLNIATTVTSASNAAWADLYLWDSATINITDGADISGFTDLNMNGDSGGDGGNATLNMDGGSFAVDDGWDIDGTTGDSINLSGGDITVPGTIDIGDSDVVITKTDGNLTAGDISDTNGSQTSNFSPPIGGSMMVNGSELPIELLDFRGEFVNASVELSWETGSEIDNDYMEVQRSYDGEEFIVVGVIEGNGTTSDVHYYSYTDRNPRSNDIIYYRLVQYDFDGQNETFDMIAVKPVFDFTNASVEIFPNPTSERVNVSFAGMEINETVQVQIVDLNGRVVLERYEELNGATLTFQNLSSLKEGVYLINISTGTYTSSNRLMIKR